MIACPAATSSSPDLWCTRSVPRKTTVYSSKSGVCPGSSQPSGLRIWATLTPGVEVLTRPTYSSMILGLVPADSMRVGCGIRVGMVKHGNNWRTGDTSGGGGPSDLRLVEQWNDGTAGYTRIVESDSRELIRLACATRSCEIHPMNIMLSKS